MYAFFSVIISPSTNNNDSEKTTNSNVHLMHNRNLPSRGPNRVHRDSNHLASVDRPTNRKDMGGIQAYTINPAITHSQRPPPATRRPNRVLPFQIRASTWDVVPHMLLHSHRYIPSLRYKLRRNQQCNRPRNRSPRRHTCNHIQHRTARGTRTILSNSCPSRLNPSLDLRLLRHNLRRDNLLRANNNPKSNTNRRFTHNSSHNCTMLSRSYPYKHNLRAWYRNNSNLTRNLNNLKRQRRKHIPKRKRKRSNRAP